MTENEQTIPKVLYIMGTARSGSTILEIMLSKGEGCFGAGEISSLVQDGFIEDKPCSCGETFSQCGIWGKVASSLEYGRDELHRWAEVQQKLDWHDGMIRQLIGRISDDEQARYRNWNRALLRQIGLTTGASVIVDSSKYAGRALALDRMVEAEVLMICLTRSPEGLMNSFQKANRDEQKAKKPVAALAYYVVALALLRLVISRVGARKVMMLRYEDMITNPEATIRIIGGWSGIDFSETLNRLRGRLEFEVGHVVTGNRLRKKGAVHFNAEDNRKVEGMGVRVVLAAMNGWRRMLRF